MKNFPSAFYLIGIAGSSCCGKTSIAMELASRLEGHSPVLTLDSYYRDFSSITPKERDDINFDIPESLDHDLIYKHIMMLTSGNIVEKPVYDYATHLRKGTEKISPPDRFLIVEGLYAFYREDIRRLYNLKVFIDLADEIAFERRIKRDVSERGSSREYVIRQYKMMVRPMFNKYILSTRKYADLVLDGTRPVKDSVEEIIKAIYKKSS